MSAGDDHGQSDRVRRRSRLSDRAASHQKEQAEQQGHDTVYQVPRTLADDGSQDQDKDEPAHQPIGVTLPLRTSSR